VLGGSMGLAAGLSGAASAAPESVFGKSGNFNLDDPRDRLLARIKINASLTGERSYIYNISRHMMCEPGKVPYQILAELELVTIWIEPTPGARAPAKIGSLFTRIPVDPLTFQPISDYTNPTTGRTIALKPTLFGGTGLPLDPDDPKPNIVFQQNKPHYRMGDKLVIVNFDPNPQEGPHQPRVDSAMLTANHAEVMDPARGSVVADYCFSAYFPAPVYKWSDLPADDPARVFSMKLGRKVFRREDIPAEFQRTIIAQFPERV
jgi:hypothetical protein